MNMRTKIGITNVWHIALATDDIDQSVERYWKDLGIGPWQHLTMSFPERTASVYGKQVSMDVNAAVTQVGFLTLGFDQPLTKPNPFEEILNKRGGGAHHLAFVVDDIAHARKQMRSLRYREILSVNEIGPNGDGAAAYFDTVEDMGTVIELSKLPSQLPGMGKVYPAADEVKRTSNIDIRGVVHVAIAVRDAEKAAQHYLEVLGIGPWKIITFEASGTDPQGREAKVAIKAALIMMGTFVLALEQPLTSPSPLQDFLDKNGPGIHHLCLEVNDFHRSAEEMRRLGYAETFSAYNIGPNRDGDTAYFDTESTLGIVIELFKLPGGLSMPDMFGIPEWSADVPNGNIISNSIIS